MKKFSHTIFLVFISLIIITSVSCNEEASNEGASVGFVFVAFPEDIDIPAGMSTVQGWIDDQDDDSIRVHSWEIWRGLTADSGQTFNGRMLPVWETWYTPQEIFPSDPVNISAFRTRATNFENPHENFKDEIISSQSITSFVKGNRLYADHIWNNQYNVADVLTELNAFFNDISQETIDRKIFGLPQGTTALKPVFMLVKQSGLTAVPYWRGAANSSNTTNPTPDTWNQCVAVDPSDEMVGQQVSMSCNGTNQTMNVISLSEFHFIELTKLEVDEMSQTVIGFVGTAEEGDFVILVAMHVTTKEIPNWTWQTFWWDPDPDNASFPAEERPADKIAQLTAPWNNYVNCTAYYMVDPPVTGTEPKICFSPHLETGLTSIDGIESNCMTCHHRATWGTGGSFGGGLDYQANGFISDTDSDFDDVTRLDFLWSITRAANTE